MALSGTRVPLKWIPLCGVSPLKQLTCWSNNPSLQPVCLLVKPTHWRARLLQEPISSSLQLNNKLSDTKGANIEKLNLCFLADVCSRKSTNALYGIFLIANHRLFQVPIHITGTVTEMWRKITPGRKPILQVMLHSTGYSQQEKPNINRLFFIYQWVVLICF